MGIMDDNNRRKFFRFLKNNRARDRFAVNSNHIDNVSRKLYDFPDNLYSFLKTDKTEDWIENAFLWKKTKEGHEFWLNLSNKYEFSNE